MGVSGKTTGRTSRGHLRKTSGVEVEIKLPVADGRAVLRLLKRLKASGGPRMHEMNTLYDTPTGTLARQGKLVRIRVLTMGRAAGKAARKAASGALQRAVVLTYKGPAQGGGGTNKAHGLRYKVREERELCVDDGGALAQVFEGMGLQPRFRYEKYRTTYGLPGMKGLVVEFDETPIGTFLELEGDAAAIDRGAALLGYQPTDYITKNYGQLFQERRLPGSRAGRPTDEHSRASDSADMMFPRRK